MARPLRAFIRFMRAIGCALRIDRMFVWIGRVIRGDRVLIDYYIDVESQKFSTNTYYARISEAQAYAMGYVKGVKMLDRFSEIPFKSYVRFHPDLPPVPSESLETASTLYDHWRSNATAKFLHGMMTKKTLAPIEMKQLIMIGIIAAAAAAGILLLVF